jgi:hypothetical protein
MLIRISLIVAIIAGLAVGGLNLFQVKEKVTALMQERDSERSQKEAAQTELADTKRELDQTDRALKETRQTLEITTNERDAARSEADQHSRRASQLAEDLANTRMDRDNARSELARYEATQLTPEQVAMLNKQLRQVQENLAGAEAENKELGQMNHKLRTELAIYRDPQFIVPLPAALSGSVIVADPKWDFVIVNVGENQGALEHGELLVNRNGRLVAKVVIRTVQKDRSVANVLPGWKLGEVMEGDQVIPAHPAS